MLVCLPRKSKSTKLSPIGQESLRAIFFHPIKKPNHEVCRRLGLPEFEDETSCTLEDERLVHLQITHEKKGQII